MKYIYTAENCPRCEALKKKLHMQGIAYKEREAGRISKPADYDNPGDAIDVEAFIQLSMQNMKLPVEVEIDENKK